MAADNTTNHVVNVTDNGSTDRLIRNIETLLNRVGAVQNAANRINMGGTTQPGAGQAMPGGPRPPMGGTAGSRSVADSAMSGSAYGTLRATGAGTGAAGRDFAKESQGLGGLVRLYATYAANVFAVSAAFGALSRAMDTTNMISSMNQLGASVGKSLGSVSKNIVQLTGGAISLQESMQAVAKTSAAGIANKDIERLAVVAKNASLSLGISLPDALSRLSRGVTKLEPELLDELGLFTKIGPATEAYARSVGKTVGSLTDFEKRQAFTNAVIKEGEDKFAALGDAVNVNPYDKLIASLQNLAQNGLEIVNKVLGPIVKLLSENPAALTAAIAAIGLAIVKQALPAFGQFREGLKNSTEEAKDLAIKKAKEAQEARRKIERLATKEFEADADNALKAVVAQEKKIEELRKKGQFDPAGATAQALAKDTADVNGRDFKKMEQERRKYLKEGNTQAAEAVKGTMESFKSYQTLEEQVTKVRMAEQERTKELEKGNSRLASNIEAARKAQDNYTKETIVSAAATNQGLIGAGGAWQLLKQDIESSGLELSKFEKASLKARGGVAILTSALVDLGAAVGNLVNRILVAIAVYEVLDSFLSGNSKEMSKFSSALDAANESVDNTNRTLKLMFATMNGNVNSIEGINALANAFREVSRSADEVAIAAAEAKRSIETGNAWDKLKDSVSSLWGGDVDSKLADSLSKQVLSSIDLARASGAGDKFEAEIKDLLKIDNFNTSEVTEALLKLGNEGAKPVREKIKEFGIEISNSDSRLQKFKSSLESTTKSYQEYLLSVASQDPLFKLGQNINNLGIEMQALTQGGFKEFNAALLKLGESPEKIAFFGAAFTGEFIKIRSELQQDSKVLSQFRGQLVEAQKAQREFEDANTSLVFGSPSKMTEQEQLQNLGAQGYSKYVGLKEQVKIAAENVQIQADKDSFEKAKTLFVKGIDAAFDKGAELIQTALNNGAELNAVKIAKASAQFLTGAEKAREEGRLNQQEFDIRLKTIKSNVDLMLNQDRLIAVIAENTAAVTVANLKDSGSAAEKEKAQAQLDATRAFKTIIDKELKPGQIPNFKGQLQGELDWGQPLSELAQAMLKQMVGSASPRYAALAQGMEDVKAAAAADKITTQGKVIQGKAEDVAKKLTAEASVKQALKDQLALRESIIGIADKNLIIAENTRQEEILLKNQAKEREQAEAAVNTAKLSGGPESRKNAEELLKLTKKRQDIERDTQAIQAKQKLLQVELDIINKSYEINKANLEIDMARSQVAYNSNIARLGAYGKLSGVSEELLATETARIERSRADQESAEKILLLEEDRLKKTKELEKRRDIAGDPNGVIQAEIDHTNTLSSKAKERIKIETEGKKDILNLNKQIALVEAKIAERAREYELEQSKAQTRYAEKSAALEKSRMVVSALGDIGGAGTTFVAGMVNKELENQQRLAEFEESNRKLNAEENRNNQDAGNKALELKKAEFEITERLAKTKSLMVKQTEAERAQTIELQNSLIVNQNLQEKIGKEAQRRAELTEEERQRLAEQNEIRETQIKIDKIRLNFAERIRQVNLNAALETSKREITNSEKLGKLELDRAKIDVYAQNNPSAESYLALIKSINEEESARLQTQIQISNIQAQTRVAEATAEATKATYQDLKTKGFIDETTRLAYNKLITDELAKQTEINNNAIINAQTQLDYKLRSLDVTKQQNLEQAKYNELFNVSNNLATSLKDTFALFGDKLKSVGESLGNLVTGLTENSIRQEKFAKQQIQDEEDLQKLKARTKMLSEDADSEKEYNKAKQQTAGLEKKIADDKYRNTRAELNSNAQTIGSVKKLFGEKTAAYKAFAVLEKGLAIAKIALDVQKMFSDTAATTTSVANSGTRIAATTAEAEVSAGAAIIKAISSMPFPASLVAGAVVAAAVGTILSKIGGKGPGFTSGSENTGTGTTFGDKTKPSETLKQSQEVLSNADPILMRNSSQMLRHLRSIDYNIANLGVALVRNLGTSDIATGQLGVKTGTTSTFGTGSTLLGAAGGGLAASSLGLGAYGAMSGALGSGVIGSAITASLGVAIPVIGALVGVALTKAFKTSVGIQGQGIQSGPQSLADIRSQGFQGQVYADVETKKRAFGIAYSTRQSTVTGALDADLSRTFKQIFVNAGDALISASSVLDKNLSEITGRVDGFIINLGKLNLQGLDTAAQQKLFENVVGAELDRLVTEVYPEIVNFIKVGEGAGTTLARMTYGIESANTALESLGIQAIKYTDILNKQGDVGGEIVRQSILAVETQDLIKRVIENADGSAKDIVELYTQLDTLRDRLVDLGISQDFLTEKVILAAGGTDAFSSSLEKFYDRFTTDEFKTALEISKATAVFNTLNIAVPKTREAFFTLFQTLSSTAPEAAGSLLKVIDSIDTMYKSMDKAASERKDLQRKLDELLLSSTQLRELDILNLDASNRALQRQIWAQQDLQTAAKALQTRLSDVTKTINGQITSISDYRQSLMVGDKSTLTQIEQYQRAKENLTELYRTATDSTAIDEVRNTALGKIQGASEQVLGLSKQLYASGAQYNTDQATVIGILDATKADLEKRKTDAQLQLDQLEGSNSFLDKIQSNTKSTADYIAEFLAAQSVYNTAANQPGASRASFAVGTNYVPKDMIAEIHRGERIIPAADNVTLIANNKEMLQEIRQLNQRIVNLEQAIVEGNMINAAATDRNTDAIVVAIESGTDTTLQFNRLQKKGTLK
jgi:hypothetical protein